MGQAEVVTGNDGLKWKPVESRCPVCNGDNFIFKGFRGPAKPVNFIFNE